MANQKQRSTHSLWSTKAAPTGAVTVNASVYQPLSAEVRERVRTALERDSTSGHSKVRESAFKVKSSTRLGGDLLKF